MLRIENSKGTIEISSTTLAYIVGYAATTCFGVAGMVNKSATEGIVALLRRENYDKGIKVSVVNDALEIDLHISVAYGLNIGAISESIIHKVKYSVENLTGYPVSNVTVFVDDMKF
jgi:uncharacterized alkaline shock family protein YloU